MALERILAPPPWFAGTTNERRIIDAEALLTRWVESADKLRHKLERGTRPDGRRYARGTVTAYRASIRDYEQLIREGAAELSEFKAAPWRTTGETRLVQTPGRATLRVIQGGRAG